ncbi:MAG: Glu-tRNA(Gln) amidotransferase subunit GatD, partial [archaeon]|nr:Glu-tRNA(Gln) amidotransferase subunit GatD [archaeon]
GSILPEVDEDKGEIIRLKLKSGYNAGIKIPEITSIKKLGEGKSVGKAKHMELIHNPKLPKISILHTGGTIASRIDYRTGSVFSSFEPKDLITMYPELGEKANIDSVFLSNMWSDDLRFEHLELIAKAIQKEFEKGSKGIIIGIGTDNLAVASAGISFAVEKCPIPIIFVGSQRSSDRPSADGAMNLICAAEFIAQTDFAGVAICMHNSTNDDKCAILPATKTRKLHTSRRDAFKAINDSPIALVDFKTKQIEFLKKAYTKRSNEKMIVKPKFEKKVGLLKISIGMFPEQFELFNKSKFKGLVIEGTGLGHTPGHSPNKEAAIHKKFFPILAKFSKQGVIVMTSQCINGRVQMHVYDKGTDLVKLGVIPGEDMLAETAMVKLSWLLGNYKKEQVKEMIAKNLRGEITERTEHLEIVH